MKRMLLFLMAVIMLALAGCGHEPEAPRPQPPAPLSLAGTRWICDQMDDLNASQQAHLSATLSFLDATGSLSVHAELLNNGEPAGSTDRQYDIASYSTHLNGGSLTFADGTGTTFSVADGEMELLAPFVLTGTILHFSQQ